MILTQFPSDMTRTARTEKDALRAQILKVIKAHPDCDRDDPAFNDFDKNVLKVEIGNLLRSGHIEVTTEHEPGISPSRVTLTDYGRMWLKQWRSEDDRRRGVDTLVKPCTINKMLGTYRPSAGYTRNSGLKHIRSVGVPT